MAYVEIETPDGVRQVRLDRPCISIGRLSYNDVALPYSQISRQHAELRLVDGVWWIADLHSTNGLHVGAERVGEQRLTDGAIVALAPDIHLRYVAEAGDEAPRNAPAPAVSRPSPASGLSGGDTTRPRPWLLEQGASSGGRRPSAGPAPQAPAPPSARGVTPARPASTPAAHPGAAPTPRPASTPAARAFGPRSPFADDEERYIPPGMVAQGGASAAPLLPPVPGIDSFAPPPAQHATAGMNDVTASYGYRSPSGAITGGAGYYDPYQRATGAPAPSLLHVCQTCGQLTAPDAVYCQNCHHPIAYECPNCHLSLLPIQDRCPRCQAPNPASVRRAHRNPGG